MSEFKVGDELFCVEHLHYGYGEVRCSQCKVTKVGRKWIYLDNDHRMDKETMRLDGGDFNSPGRCYLSESDYRDRQAIVRILHSISNEYRWTMNRDNLPPLEDVKKAARLLRVPVEEGE